MRGNIHDEATDGVEQIAKLFIIYYLKCKFQNKISFIYQSILKKKNNQRFQSTIPSLLASVSAVLQ